VSSSSLNGSYGWRVSGLVAVLATVPSLASAQIQSLAFGPETAIDQPLSPANSQHLVAAARLAGTATLLWADGRTDPPTLMTAPVDAQGAPGATHMGPSSVSTGPAASDGQNFFFPSLPPTFTEAVLMSPTGTVLAVGAPRAHSPVETNPVFDGTNFLIVGLGQFWGYRYDTAGHLLEPNGVPLLFPGNPLLTGGTFNGFIPPVAACRGSACLIVWGGPGAGGTGVVLQSSVLTGTTLTAAAVLPFSNAPILDPPLLASSPGGWLVILTEFFAGTPPYRLRAIRISPQGLALDSPPLLVAQVPTLAQPINVTFDGEAYVVSWTIGSAVTGTSGYIARVTVDGTVPAGEPLQFGPSAVTVIASSTTAGSAIGSLIAYERSVGGTSRLFVRARVAPSASDAGVGGPETGATDAAAGPDAGATDAGLPPVDAGAVADADVASDTATTDHPDAATDASATDAAAMDAPVDAGRPPHHGRGCSTGDSDPAGSTGWFALGLLVAVALARRARRSFMPVDHAAESRNMVRHGDQDISSRGFGGCLRD
jgi:MYXO-CTERM domain-containing protein